MALTLLEHPGHMVPQPLQRLLAHKPHPPVLLVLALVLLVLAPVLLEVMAQAALDLPVLVAPLPVPKDLLELLVHLLTVILLVLPPHLQAVILLDLPL